MFILCSHLGLVSLFTCVSYINDQTHDAVAGKRRSIWLKMAIVTGFFFKVLTSLACPFADPPSFVCTDSHQTVAFSFLFILVQVQWFWVASCQVPPQAKLLAFLGRARTCRCSCKNRGIFFQFARTLQQWMAGWILPYPMWSVVLYGHTLKTCQCRASLCHNDQNCYSQTSRVNTDARLQVWSPRLFPSIWGS